MKKVFVGLDLAKDNFHCCIIDQNHQVLLKNQVFANNQSGFEQLLELLQGLPESQAWLLMEYTGVYGDLLCSFLSYHQLSYCLLNPLELKYSMGITRGKTDPVDAYRIALYGVRHALELRPHQLLQADLKQLSVLMGLRQLYVKIKVQAKNRLAALRITAQQLDMKAPIEDLLELIQAQEQKIQRLERQMIALIKASSPLKINYDKITQVIGVGPITAIMCLVKTQNFTKITEARKFSCYCGIAPFKHESGSSVRGRTRVSHRADKSMKTTLASAVLAAIVHDPQLKAYYRRKLKEGKNEFSVRNAVANKLIARIFAVAKREESFIKLTA